MKTIKKVLSIMLCALMVLTVIPMTAFAETQTAEQFISNENLCVIADRLIKDLAGRMDTDMGTILRLVFQFMDDDSLTAAIGGKDVMTLTDEQLADILVNWLNANLPTWTEDIPTIKLGSVTVDLSSVDGVINSLNSITSSSIIKGIAGGDAKELTNTGLVKNKKTITKKNGFTSKQVICALFNWLADDGQIYVINEVIKGDLNLSKTIESFGLSLDSINDTMKDLPNTIKALIYDIFCEFKYTKSADGTYKKVDDTYVEIEDGEEVADRYSREKIDFEDSSYAKFSADELLGAAVINLFNNGNTISQKEANEAASLTFYQLLGKYADTAITMYAVEPINGQFKRWLQNDVVTDANYAFLNNAINWDYNVTADTFNLDNVATKGIFAELNTIFCGFLKEILKPDVYNTIGLVDGDNTNLQSNLDKLVKWFLNNIPDTYEGYDFTSVKANVNTNTLEQNAVAVIELFFPDWFGSDYVIPANITSLEQLGAFAAYCAIDKFVANNKDDYADWANGNYKAQVLDENGNMLTKTDDQWIDTILTIGLDVAVYALNHNNEATKFTLSVADAQKYKAEGWTYEYYLDDIADWGVNYIKGIPAITDELTGVQGEYDGFGPWYKINVALNSLLPLSLFTDCGDGYFDFDSKTVFMDKLLGNLLDFNLEGIVSILYTNNNEGNIFNQTIISGVLNTVENLLFSLFEYDKTVGSEKSTLEATETSVGYEYVKGTNSKFYRATKTLDKIATESDVVMGDVNSDGKINAKDARLVLRYSAKLETLSEAQITAADVNGNGKADAKDARKILRYSAKLETSLT